MPLSARDIFNKLSEWPHRGAGSEDEMMAREMLTTELLGEPGVEVTEEGLAAPTSYLPFFWVVAVAQVFFVFTAAWMPYMALLGGLIIMSQHVLFFDWRVSPLIWLCPKKITANLVAKKGEGRRLFVLMAHLDSAPASFAYRPEQVGKFKEAVWAGTLVTGLGVLVPFFDVIGWSAPVWLRYFIAAMVLSQPVIASIDFWRHGYTPGANDNLSGVAAAVAAASRLWRTMPADAEVRLVITTAEEAGMLGAQHYVRAHESELKARPTYVLNFDTVGCKNLRYVIESGGFTPVRYTGKLAKAADTLAQSSSNFRYMKPGKHSVGDFDSVWFNREGIDSLTLASYDDQGLMPYIHTPEDRTEHVDLDQVVRSALFGEALVRTIPR